MDVYECMYIYGMYMCVHVCVCACVYACICVISKYISLSTTTACNISLVFVRERNVLFNDTLNTFYLKLYGVRHMVKDNSGSEKGNLLSPHRLLLLINSKGSFICTIPQTG